jgi:hypothetical protein
MSLFSRQPKSVLPPNLAALLAEWGRAFPPPGVPEGSTDAVDDFVHGLISLQPEQMREAVTGIRDVGLREGGWTAYGAWELLNMTCTRDVPPEFLRELSEPRVRLIHSLEMSGYPAALCTADTVAWEEVFSDDTSS